MFDCKSIVIVCTLLLLQEFFPTVVGCHCLLVYHDLRTQYISTYYYRKSSMYKFKELFILLQTI